MTISTTNNRDAFTGDNSTTIFAYTFYTQSTGDVTVYLDGVLQASGYTVSRTTGGVGGNVTFSTAPGTGVVILILRALAYTQGTDIPVESNFPEDSIEDIGDKATMLVQQLKEIVDRCAKLGITSDGTVDMEMAAPVALNVLRWASDGLSLEHVTPSTAFADANPSAGLGDVIGPGATVVDESIAIMDGTGGFTIKSLASQGNAGEFLKSQGAGLPPVFAALPGTTDATPSGVVAMWPFAYADIPTGWESCEGQTVTVNTDATKVAPDMRGFFPLGAADGDPSPANGGYTGAGIVIAADTAAKTESGSLTHSHNQQGTFVSTASSSNTNNIGNLAQTAPTPVHTHNTTISGATTSTDQQPMAVCMFFIIKVD